MNSISLNRVLPHPLKNNVLNENSVWGKEFTIVKGDFCLVCAPSGTGKTTFVSSIYGIRNDYSGSILFDERNTKDLSLVDWSAIRQKEISFVFQDLLLFSQLSVIENIQLKQQLFSTKSIEEIKEMAFLLGIENKLENKCGLLSLGQQQRVAIIRALCQPFSFLLLDEPFSHLDEQNAKNAAALINTECIKQGAGIIVTGLSNNSYFNYTKTISV